MIPCSLACRCAQAASSLGYTMFGLQNYGECWSGSESCDQYSRHGDSQLCIGQNYTMCDINDDNECIGKGGANFVYLLLEGKYCTPSSCSYNRATFAATPCKQKPDSSVITKVGIFWGQKSSDKNWLTLLWIEIYSPSNFSVRSLFGNKLSSRGNLTCR